MNLLTIVLSIGLMVFLGREAVELQKLTVCRQEAWRSSVTLHTRTLLTKKSPSEKDFLPRCQVVVSRNEKRVSWVRLTSPRRNNVSLNLRGKL